MSNNINKIMEAYKSMVSEGKELDEMRGATAGRRQSRVFPLNKKGEAEAFAKKHGGKVEKKGATLYVTWDLPESVDLDEERKYKAPTKAEIEADKKKDGKKSSGDRVKNLNKKVYGNMMGRLKEEEEIEEAKMPSKAEIHKVLGPTKNSEEGIKAIMKKFGCDRPTAEKCLKSVMEELEEKKLDPVNDKENDKEFKDREDKDIDNDGDVDSSDEYLHKRRKATDDAIDAKKQAKEDEEVPAPKKPKVSSRSQSTKDIKHNDHTSDKKAEISKIESVDTREAFIAMWSELEEAVNPKKGATAPEEIDSKESPKSKEFIAKHKQSDKKIEDGEEEGHDMATKAGRVTKQAPNRGNDNLSNGDKKPVKGN